jgi:hypothetical protein
MLRLSGFTPNGRTTPSTCYHCGAAVTMQHGRYPGELFQRHYFECPGCLQRHWLCPLYDCEHCRGGDNGQTVYLIRVGGDCVWRFGRPQNLPVIERPVTAVQLSLFQEAA